jgi:hypothetical protein
LVEAAIEQPPHSPASTVRVSALANDVPLARPLEYDTWGRTILFGINYKL